MTTSIFKILLIGSLLQLAGCAHYYVAENDFYHELGGAEGIENIVDHFLFEIADDKKIEHHFEDTNIDRFREKLMEQFCYLSGGPCEYTGDSMAVSHEKMDITEGEFNSLVEDLIRAMESLQVPVAVQNRLLAKLVPMYDEVMGNSEMTR